MTIALYPNAEPLQYGLVLQDRQGFVQHFIEKPDWEHVVTDLVNTGTYIVSPRAMTYVPEDQPFDFAKDLFPLLLAAHEPILGVPMDGYWCDIGTPRAYYQCSLDVLDGRLSPARPDAPDDLPPQITDPNCRTVPCRDRAHLMRTISEAMMEAGADFTDGLHMRDGSWELTIRPDANAAALQVEANAPDAAAETAHLLELMERDENL
ncbi:MAG: sugar phosphate nucleotidyltransferase [Oscillospiraceae bacterium]